MLIFQYLFIHPFINYSFCQPIIVHPATFGKVLQFSIAYYRHGLLEEDGRETKFLQNNVGADLFKCLYLDEELVFGGNLFTRFGEIYPAFQ